MAHRLLCATGRSRTVVEMAPASTNSMLMGSVVPSGSVGALDDAFRRVCRDPRPHIVLAGATGSGVVVSVDRNGPVVARCVATPVP